MIGIQKILFAHDFSQYSQAALSIAYSLARDYRARLVVLHVRPDLTPVYTEFGAVPPDEQEPDESVIGRMRAALVPSTTDMIDFRVRSGDAATEIIQAAQDEGCDLIVVGTHGRSGVGRLLMGSVAEAVLRQAPCPVLTVKPPTSVATESEGTPADEAETDMDDLQTVCTVGSSTDAEVIRVALQSEGIPAIVDGGQQAGFTGNLGIPVKVQVRTRDYDRANELIRSHEEHEA